jgi:ribosomal-protein-alanine N-acetyltransferase
MMLEINFSPFPEITTTRLLLGPIQKADAKTILSLRSDEKAMQYIDKERTKTIAEAEALIKRITDDADNNEGITWRISLKEDPGQLVGTIGFWRIIKQHHRAEIGYMLHPALWGKGLMNEAVRAIIDFGFNSMQLHSIEAHINPANAGSAAILEKMGFIREGYFKEDYYFRGKFGDSAVYSLLNKK